MSVISLRIKQRDAKRIEALSQREQKDKSTIARELLEYGWDFLMLKQYREGKLSLSSLASQLDLSLSETIALLSEFGIQAPIDYDDYLQGYEIFSDHKKR